MYQEREQQELSRLEAMFDTKCETLVFGHDRLLIYIVTDYDKVIIAIDDGKNVQTSEFLQFKKGNPLKVPKPYYDFHKLGNLDVAISYSDCCDIFIIDNIKKADDEQLYIVYPMNI